MTEVIKRVNRTWTFGYRFPGGTHADMRRSYSERMFRPDSVSIVVNARHGHGVTVQSVDVSGPMILKGGKRSQHMRGERHFYVMDDKPEWLKRLVDEAHAQVTGELARAHL